MQTFGVVLCAMFIVAVLLLVRRKEHFDGGAEAAIIGGTKALESRFPWACRLLKPSGYCSGV